MAVDDVLRRSSRLPQSNLIWTFGGKLVDQDPSGEPASALLERIRAERGATRTSTARRRKSRGAAS